MRITLIDDEPLALEFLEIQLKKLKDVDITSINKLTFVDLNKHADLIKNTDLIFLDIEMPGRNGLELAEYLFEINVHLQIVFVTAFNEYAVQAFELNALDYILKPVQLDRLQKTFERLNVDKIPVTLPISNELHIKVCGELSFEQGGESKVIKWRTAKAQELFLFLLHNTERTVRKAELVELLWPDFEVERAYSQLYTAIYNIRKTLSEYANHLTVKSVQDGYILIKRNTSIDIEEWKERIINAPPIHIETVQTYEEIMSLYTGAYLKEYDYIWAESRQYRLEKLWLKVANRIAEIYKKNNRLEDAVKWYVQICNLKPDDELANFSLMKLYAQLEYGLLVNHQYAQLQKALKDIDIIMSPDISQWYMNWREQKSKS